VTKQQPAVLKGIKVVEYGNLVSGPYCAQLLGHAGADVVKIEPLEGDDSRRRGPFPDDRPDPERSGLYLALNFNKRSVTLNLHTEEGQKILRHLLEDTDVFVVNGSAPELDKLGLSWETLKGINQRLIFAAITPYGLTGPYRNYLGDDLTSVSLGGLMYASPGIPDSPESPETEPPLRANTFASDFQAGIYGAILIQIALMKRDLLGEMGCKIDISQAQTVASLLVFDIANATFIGPKKREPVIFGSMPNIYLPCADGHVAIVGMLENHWQGILKMLGNPDWGELELFENSYERARNWDALEPFFLEWTLAHTGQEITDMAQKMGVPIIHAHSVGEVVESDHLKSRGSFLTLSDPDKGPFKIPGFPMHLQESPWQMHRPPPRLGEHTAELLIGLGYSKEDLQEMSRLGYI
jgi:formyl-CoA transferase